MVHTLEAQHMQNQNETLPSKVCVCVCFNGYTCVCFRCVCALMAGCSWWRQLWCASLLTTSAVDSVFHAQRKHGHIKKKKRIWLLLDLIGSSFILLSQFISSQAAAVSEKFQICSSISWIKYFCSQILLEPELLNLK